MSQTGSNEIVGKSEVVLFNLKSYHFAREHHTFNTGLPEGQWIWTWTVSNDDLKAARICHVERFRHQSCAILSSGLLAFRLGRRMYFVLILSCSRNHLTQNNIVQPFLKSSNLTFVTRVSLVPVMFSWKWIQARHVLVIPWDSHLNFLEFGIRAVFIIQS